jgi:hypothetical protein
MWENSTFVGNDPSALLEQVVFPMAIYTMPFVRLLVLEPEPSNELGWPLG